MILKMVFGLLVMCCYRCIHARAVAILQISCYIQIHSAPRLLFGWPASSLGRSATISATSLAQSLFFKSLLLKQLSSPPPKRVLEEMAPRRSTSGVCMALAATAGLTAFVQPAVLGRPVAAERLSGVAMKVSAQDQEGNVEGSWGMPFVAGAAALLVMSLSGPAQAYEPDKGVGEMAKGIQGTQAYSRSGVVPRDVTYDVPGENDLFAKVEARNLSVAVTAQQNADVTKAVEGLEGPKVTKTSQSK